MSASNRECRLKGYIQNNINALKCGICNKAYTAPKQLSCGHSFCATCLLDHVKTQGKDGAFPCPTCGESNSIPDNSQYTESVFHQSIKAISKLFTKEGIICSCCDENKKASVACFSCGEMLCNACKDAHRKFKVTRDHTVCPISDLTKGGELHKFQRMQYSVCETHNGEVKKYYCEDDKTPICGLCVHDEKHTLHTITSLVVKVDQTIEGIKELAVSCSAQRDELVSSISSLKEKMIAVDNNRDQILKSLQDLGLKMHQMIDNYINQSTNDATEQSKTQVDELQELLMTYKRELDKRNDAIGKADVLEELAISNIQQVASDLSAPLEAMSLSAPATLDQDGLDMQFPSVSFIHSTLEEGRVVDALPSLIGFVSPPPYKEPKSITVIECHLNDKLKEAAITAVTEAYELHERRPRDVELYSSMSKFIKDHFDQKHKVRNKPWQCVVGTRSQFGLCLIRYGENYISMAVDQMTVELFVLK